MYSNPSMFHNFKMQVAQNIFPTDIRLHSFFIRTSNFGAEADRSYLFFFLRFEPENVLSMFLKLCGIVFQ